MQALQQGHQPVEVLQTDDVAFSRFAPWAGGHEHTSGNNLQKSWRKYRAEHDWDSEAPKRERLSATGERGCVSAPRIASVDDHELSRLSLSSGRLRNPARRRS